MVQWLATHFWIAQAVIAGMAIGFVSVIGWCIYSVTGPDKPITDEDRHDYLENVVRLSSRTPKTGPSGFPKYHQQARVR